MAYKKTTLSLPGWIFYSIVMTLIVVATVAVVLRPHTVQKTTEHKEAKASKVSAVIETSCYTASTESLNQTTTVEYINEGVMTPSNLTVEQLRQGLLYNLKDYAEVFIEAEKETGINAVFLASVSAQESGWGTSYLATHSHNLYGWTGDYGYKKFNSNEECILTVANELKVNYLTPGGKHFNGYTVSAINKDYNGRITWEQRVTNIMNEVNVRVREVGNEQ